MSNIHGTDIQPLKIGKKKIKGLLANNPCNWNYAVAKQTAIQYKWKIISDTPPVIIIEKTGYAGFDDPFIIRWDCEKCILTRYMKPESGKFIVDFFSIALAKTLVRMIQYPVNKIQPEFDEHIATC